MGAMSAALDTQDESVEWAMERVAQFRLNGAQQHATPSLESLPAELRLRVLASMPDLESLGSLIQASPVYFAHYRLDRETLLSCCLEPDMCGEVLIDAIAAFNSQPSEIGRLTQPNSNVTDFLDLYGWWRYTHSPIAMLKSVSLAEIRWIMCNHTSTVRPLTTRFANMTLEGLKYYYAHYVEPWEREADSEESQAPRPAMVWPDDVRRTERTRILRAIYRFQIFCNLFGGKQSQSFTSEEIQQIFLCQFDAWEIEEMNCFSECINKMWANVSAAVKRDVDIFRPKFSYEKDFGFALEASLRLDGEIHMHAIFSRGMFSRFITRICEFLG